MTESTDLVAVLRGIRGRPVDAARETELTRAVTAYRAGGLSAIGRLSLARGGKAYPSFYQAVLDPSPPADPLAISLSETAPPGPAWKYLRRFDRMTFDGDGSVDVFPSHGAPDHAIARVLPREGFGMPPVGTDFGPGRLASLPGFVSALRAGGYVPFGVALEIYHSLERVRYEVDLFGGQLLADPRSGRWNASAPRRRSRAAWQFDRVVSSSGLAPDLARVLEALWESGGASQEDLLRFSRGPPGGRDRIEELSELRWIEEDPETGGWKVRSDAIGRTARSSSASFADREGDSALRHNMGELIAGAEARATCPMCGGEFPLGYKGLVCERCAREIAGTPSEG